jgi:hypothetical protein
VRLSSNRVHLFSIPPMYRECQLACVIWRLADDRARVAEARLGDAWAKYDVTLVGPPGADLIAEAVRLRSMAEDQLAIALSLIAKAC